MWWRGGVGASARPGVAGGELPRPQTTPGGGAHLFSVIVYGVRGECCPGVKVSGRLGNSIAKPPLLSSMATSVKSTWAHRDNYASPQAWQRCSTDMNGYLCCLVPLSKRCRECINSGGERHPQQQQLQHRQ
ncbi:hypothetical protein E2C01_087104 [Portunus trituberculatus]|uniref:Uncharacterized protein n=1 Tax=Portunus trituberculatus TaxID=210409 RepID=A0A5B7JI59_PORTR|nr:hypothetical protein [Portunus trituberculatus]